MNTLQIFEHEGFTARTIEDNGEIWIVAKDVAQSLGYERFDSNLLLNVPESWKGNSEVWRQYPHTMILKVAESMALKRAFSISGLVTDDELGYQGTTNLEQQQLSRKDICRNVWFRYLNDCNGDKKEAIKLIKSLVGDKPSSQWTDADIKELNN